MLDQLRVLLNDPVLLDAQLLPDRQHAGIQMDSRLRLPRLGLPPGFNPIAFAEQIIIAALNLPFHLTYRQMVRLAWAVDQ
ncbi:hypothetical protein D3C81_2266570 [compost metagenome]